MIPVLNSADVLSKKEKETIHRNTLRILDEIGVQIENDNILSFLSDHGFSIDQPKQRVYFPASTVEEFLSECPKINWETRVPKLIIRCSCYAGRYHVPGTEEFKEWTPGLLQEYITLAHLLPEVQSCFLTGCQFRTPPQIQPLYERFNSWKYGAIPSGTLYPYESAPALWEFFQTYAGLKKKEVKEIFSGGVFLVSPLRFPAEEAKQFWWWFQKGMHIGFAHMTTAGTSAPATIAGLVTIHLAESIAIAILQHAFYGTKYFNLTTMMGINDMKTMIRPYGRPELSIANMAAASMARWYGVEVFGHSGLTDAKLPTEEVGAQKIMNTLATLLTGADALIDVGTLSMDEVASPIQAILDCELARVLQQYLKEFEITDGTISFQTINEVGPGGLFIDSIHTIQHFRKEFWIPQIWQQKMFTGWENSGCEIDSRHALKIYNELINKSKLVNELSEYEEQELMRVIEGLQK